MSSQEPSGVRQRPQFSLAALLVAMMTLGVTFAGTYYLVHGGAGAEGMQLAGLLLLLAGPLVLVALVSGLLALVRQVRRRR